MWDQMRLLWFSHFVPFPPRGGNFQRSFNLIRHVSKSYEISLLAFNLQGLDQGTLAEYTGELKKYCANVEIWELPRRWRSWRWWAELTWSPLYRAPYGARSFWSPLLAARWQHTLARHQGVLVHFDSIDLGLFVGAAADFRKVLNHHNCESAMAYRRAQKEPNPVKKAYLWHQARKIERQEREVCHLFDVNLAVSDVDAQTLLSRSPKAHIHIVENGTDTSYFVPTDAPAEPRSLIFAGLLRWYPNVSAVQYFVREIWPLVKLQCPGVRFYVAGQRPSESLVERLTQDPNIVVVPSPDDIRPWVARGAVFVCPILDGGGTKLKILDALAMGKAVVSTAIGCEGLQVKHGENILVADTPRDFAREVLRALGNEPLRKQLGTMGRALVEKQYSWEVISGHLEQAYRCASHSPRCDRQGVRVGGREP